MGLRDVRLKRGLNQTELAQISGVEQGTISIIESSADPNPRWHTVRRLCRALRVKPHELFSSRKVRVVEKNDEAGA